MLTLLLIPRKPNCSKHSGQPQLHEILLSRLCIRFHNFSFYSFKSSFFFLVTVLFSLQVQVITTALNAAQATAEHAAQAASEAAAELAAQTTMVGQAKARAHAIDEQLETARIDFEATQAAAQKAAALAQKAQNNAAAAAAHAAHAASEAAAASIGNKQDHEALQNSVHSSENVHHSTHLIRDPANLRQSSSLQEPAPLHLTSSLNTPGNDENYSANHYDSASPYTTSAISSSSYSSSGPLDYDYKSSARVLDYPSY